MKIRVRDIAKDFGELSVLKGISFDIPDNQVTAILGPSGCGKTTLLNILSGSLLPDTGTIEGIADHRLSYLFQEPRLLPWKTVEGNINFILGRRFPTEQRTDLVERVIKLVDLSDFRKFYPRELSGGMKQRVAIARAFAFPSDLLLMDEPFQALDIRLKLSLLEVFNTVWTKDHRTSLFVTHDIQEALLLGDSMVVFSPRPAEILGVYSNPVPREERKLQDSRLLDLEGNLYRLLTGI